MKTLFTGNFYQSAKFIFDLYDFDKNGLISREDIRTVLSYVAIDPKNKQNRNNVLKFGSQSFEDRVESQEELHLILEKCFKECTSEYMDLNKFLDVVENVCSDIYFFILVFLMQMRPFSKTSILEYEKQKNPEKKENNNNLKINSSPKGFLVASPSLTSKFSPSKRISKSPSVKGNKADILEKLSTRTGESIEYLQKLTGKPSNLSPIPKDQFLKVTKTMNVDDHIPDEIIKSPSIPVNRKIRNDLKKINEMTSKLNLDGKTDTKNNIGDLPITPAFKQSLKKSSTINDNLKINITFAKDIEINTESLKYNSNGDSVDTSDDENEAVKYSGYLYKITEHKSLKKLWYKLVDRDFYYFKNNLDNKHKGMHSLSGVFVKEEKVTNIEGNDYFTFSITFPKKVRFYYTETKEEMLEWIRALKKATGYFDLTEIYDVKEKLGNGKFGLVRLGIHKLTGQKVAIKIMSKKEMNNEDLELVKTEIEILKVCQHPNIIKLYDIFENIDYIYIIMEYCAGNDLFHYIEKRGFKLPEKRACQIIHKLCTAVFYIHSYGITHRDIKPENILMTDDSEEADIRVVDFGLSKKIGPNQQCKEPYGTISYVAPEVLLEKPYTKAVDLWSIGVTIYLLLAGYLPFDHESSEREIARQTVHDAVRWGSAWKTLSSEAKIFVDNLLKKDPASRMDIKKTLESEWITKFTDTSIPFFRRKSRENTTSNFELYSSDKLD